MTKSRLYDLYFVRDLAVHVLQLVHTLNNDKEYVKLGAPLIVCNN